MLASGVTEKIKKSVALSGMKDMTTDYILKTVVELGKKFANGVLAFRQGYPREATRRPLMIVL